VVEVSTSSLHHDRTDKARIYARASIPVYWIVNVIDKVVEVYTQPSGPGDTPAYAKRDLCPIGTSVSVVLDGNTVGTIAVAEVMS
jgi:Uma2 family endonuclease